jgi:uncharacterized protein (DUF697 family)
MQITMVIALGKVLGQELTHSAAWALTSSAIATYMGRATSQLAVGWLPSLGNVINASTAASLTELVGWFAVSKLLDQMQAF